jgi:hypothetical protein
MRILKFGMDATVSAFLDAVIGNGTLDFIAEE